MSSRTTRSIVSFTAPFRLSGIEGELRAGQYAIDKDEDVIEGVSWLAYQRTGTFLHTPALGARERLSQVFEVDSDELEIALANDKAGAGRRDLEDKLGRRRPPETDAERYARNDTSGAMRRAGQTKRDNEIL